jgi:cell division protein FtsW
MRRAAAAKRELALEHNLLLTATFCLLAIGVVMVYSASSAPTLLKGEGNGTQYLIRFAGFGVLGLIGMWAASRVGPERLRLATGPLLVLALACLVAVRVPGLGVEANGAKRWLGAGPLTFQPSELAKLALILHGAQLLSGRRGRPLRTFRDARGLLVPAGVVAGLVALQPDLGTVLVTVFTVTALLVAAGLPGRVLLRGGFLLAGAVALYALSADYRRERLTSFLNPWDHATDAGFQAVQGQIALGSGGLLGRGVGQSVQKIFYLPEAHTDFILAIIGEEWGLVGLLVVVALYGMVAYAGLRIAQRAATPYAQLLAAGITSLILSQACLNLFAVLGLVPLTGVPLPLISYGATSVCVLLCGVGVLLGVARGQHARVRAVAAPGRGGRSAGGSRPASGARSGGGRRRASG